MSEDRTYRKLIQSRQWRRLRVSWLKAHPYCEDCLAKGKRIGATEVHHIIPVEPALNEEEKRALMFDTSNLRSLCRDCHLQTHREMKVYSKETVKKRQKARLEAVLEAFFPGIKFEETPRG